MGIKNYFKNSAEAETTFTHSTTILIELLDYMMMIGTYKTYYEYRRNIYTFRNTYLPMMLNVGTEYYMILFEAWKC